MESLKVVFVGNDGVGKTSLLTTYATKEFPAGYVPTVFDEYSIALDYKDRQVQVSLWDTAGSPEYDKLRPLSYPQTDVFVICYEVDSTESFDAVKDKYYPEVCKHVNKEEFALIVCATKTDLTGDAAKVASAAGQTLAKQLGAASHAECSAKNKQGCDELVQLTLQAGMKLKEGSNKSDKCILM